MTLHEFQSLIRRMYHDKDAARGVEGTFMWLTEEIGELATALRSGTKEEISLEFADVLDGEPRYRLDQVWEGLYAQLADPADITNLPKALRSRLDLELPTALTAVTESVSDRGDTVKFLWELAGGSRVETVLMLYADRATVCVSSQAGCAMACGFCATGQAGFTRHLTVGEIVEQVVRASQRARQLERRVSNIVFMGMGEPMANLEPVWAAVERFHGDLGLSARHITISTVGVVPGIRSLRDRPLPVNLAVSLHAANDTLRALAIIRPKDMPPVEVILVESAQPDSPYGIKGVGEIGLVPTAGAVAAALAAHDGQWRTELPMANDANRERASAWT